MFSQQEKNETADGRANFNDVTNYHEKKPFLDEIYCKECKIPVGANGQTCGKCDREFEWKDVISAIATQAKLREENQRNKKYTPPELYI